MKTPKQMNCFGVLQRFLPENNQAEQVETPDSTAEIEATANAEAESTTTAKRGKAKSAE